MSDFQSLDQIFAAALEQHEAGRLREADALYRQVLRAQPSHPGALHRRGILAHQVGRTDVAAQLFVRAADIDPTSADIQNNLGVALAALGRLEGAMNAYRRAIELRPDFAEAHDNLGLVLRDLGRIDEAIESHRGAIALRPDYAPAHHNLGVALHEKGELHEAIVAYEKALALQPDYASAHANLGTARFMLRQMDQAEKELSKAITVQEDLRVAHLNLGNVFKSTGRLDAALSQYRRGMELGDRFAGTNYLYTIHFHPNFDAARILQEHKRWHEKFVRPLAFPKTQHTNNRTPDRRLRIGYFSPHFRTHPVGRFLLPLLANHNHCEFEIYRFSATPKEDVLTARLRSAADVWRDVRKLAEEKLAGQIREDRIDILVDLAMHLEGSRMLAFARKPAPVQVTYLAYCSTTGLEEMDYRLTDPYLDPPDESRPFYTEKSVWLPQCYWCLEPHESAPQVGPLPAAQSGRITFGSLNNFTKVARPTLEMWAELLRQVDQSRLILNSPRGSHRDQLLAWLATQQVDPSRTTFVDLMPMDQYFQLYNQIDIALDPFPYGGGTTTCDALWMGVPVVSLAGQTAVSRSGLSILSNAGLPELVALDPEQYVRTAVELSQDLPRLARLRSTLREQLRASPLMDAKRFARDIETVYRNIWKDWCTR